MRKTETWCKRMEGRCQWDRVRLSHSQVRVKKKVVGEKGKWLMKLEGDGAFLTINNLPSIFES